MCRLPNGCGSPACGRASGRRSPRGSSGDTGKALLLLLLRSGRFDLCLGHADDEAFVTVREARRWDGDPDLAGAHDDAFRGDGLDLADSASVLVANRSTRLDVGGSGGLHLSRRGAGRLAGRRLTSPRGCILTGLAGRCLGLTRCGLSLARRSRTLPRRRLRRVWSRRALPGARGRRCTGLIRNVLLGRRRRGRRGSLCGRGGRERYCRGGDNAVVNQAHKSSPASYMIAGERRGRITDACLSALNAGTFRPLDGAILLEDVTAEVGVACDAAQLLVDERSVDEERLAATVLGIEAHVFEQFFHDRLQPARADILDRFVHLRSDAS